jgi:hypothetical protein
VAAHELAPENALLADRRMPRAHEQARTADDQLALLDDGTDVRGNLVSVDARAVLRAEVLHPDPTVVEQRQECMLRSRIVVLQHDVAAEVAPDAALGAGAREALAHDRLAVRAGLLDQHHGFHCRPSRKRCSTRSPDSKATPWSVMRLTSDCSRSSMLTTVMSKS